MAFASDQFQTQGPPTNLRARPKSSEGPCEGTRAKLTTSCYQQGGRASQRGLSDSSDAQEARAQKAPANRRRCMTKDLPTGTQRAGE